MSLRVRPLDSRDTVPGLASGIFDLFGTITRNGLRDGSALASPDDYMLVFN
jgi:hypothetical protein